MATALNPQKTRMPVKTPPEDEPRNGLRRWTPDEYHRMIALDLFNGDRVGLLSGDIRQVHASHFYRWTREQYHRLIEAGFFDEGRVELLEGLIWDLASQLTLHTTAVRLTQLALEDAFQGRFEVRVQMSITLPDRTEPEPDVAVAPGTPLDYLEHHPGPEDLLLVTEVSDSTLVKDRGPKLVSYAQASVAEYWIVNLVNRQLEVYRQPSPMGIYIDFTTFLPGQSVAPLNAPGKTVAVADLLPPEPKQNP